MAAEARRIEEERLQKAIEAEEKRKREEAERAEQERIAVSGMKALHIVKLHDSYCVQFDKQLFTGLMTMLTFRIILRTIMLPGTYNNFILYFNYLDIFFSRNKEFPNLCMLVLKRRVLHKQ